MVTSSSGRAVTGGGAGGLRRAAARGSRRQRPSGACVPQVVPRGDRRCPRGQGLQIDAGSSCNLTGIKALLCNCSNLICRGGEGASLCSHRRHRAACALPELSLPRPTPARLQLNMSAYTVMRSFKECVATAPCGPAPRRPFASAAAPRRASRTVTTAAFVHKAASPYAEELRATAKYISQRGRGILASDESNATTGECAPRWCRPAGLQFAACCAPPGELSNLRATLTPSSLSFNPTCRQAPGQRGRGEHGDQPPRLARAAVQRPRCASAPRLMS